MSDKTGPDQRSVRADRTVDEAQRGMLTERRGLSPRQVPEAWRIGLLAAGRKAKTARVYRNGRWETLALVVQFDCPYEHVNESGENFAKVRLKVDVVTGWVSRHEDSCRRCRQEVIERWLVTCPRCEARESLDTHPDHDEDGDWGALFFAPNGDESPFAFVIEAMYHLKTGEPSSVPGIGTSKQQQPRTEWSDESARQWLDKLVHEDGTPIVPPEASQREAWRLAQGVDGHPPQRFVHKAQALRQGPEGR